MLQLEIVNKPKTNFLSNYSLTFNIKLLFLEKSCISHILLAHWSLLLAAMETIMQKKEKRKYLKNYLLKNVNLYEAETFLYFFYENQLCSLVAMATWSFHVLLIGRIAK